MGKCYIDDVGKDIRLETHEDLTDATIKIVVKRPDGKVIEWDAEKFIGSLYSYPSIVRYITQAGDLPTRGNYVLISYAEWSAESKHSGEPVDWFIFNRFEK